MGEADKFRMVIPLMEDTEQVFQAGSEQLKDTLSQMMSIANVLGEGALLGQAGEAFVDAIQSKLCPAISRLNDKFQELQADVRKAKETMQEINKTTESLFG